MTSQKGKVRYYRVTRRELRKGWHGDMYIILDGVEVKASPCWDAQLRRLDSGRISGLDIIFFDGS